MNNEDLIITQIVQINNPLKSLIEYTNHISFFKDVFLPLVVSLTAFILPILFKFLFLKRQPNFKVFHVPKNLDISSSIFTKEVNIHLNGAISTNFEFSLKPEIKFPLFYSNKNTKCRVELVDKEDFLKVKLLNKFPGLPFRYQLDSFEIDEPNIIKHFSVLISPEKTFEKYTVYLWIYFRGKKIEEKLIVSIYK